MDKKNLMKLNKLQIDLNISKIFPYDLSRKLDLIVIKEENNKVIVGIDDTNNEVAREYLKSYYNTEIIFNYINKEHLNKIRDTVYFSDNKVNKEKVSFNKVVNSSYIIKKLDDIINLAILEKATDIHFEPYEEMIRLRFRIDGKLYNYDQISLDDYKAISMRIKILANLNTTEKRLPQDGRLLYGENETKMDLRISILPVSESEKIVIRILNKENFSFKKYDLGLTELELKKFNRIINKPYGLILLTGPAGSGKTTTLYTILNELNDTNINITSIEDPIEYKFNGINQSQINKLIEYDFDIALESILRQDPDIIMVGEIRNAKVADTVIRSAITGHLILSTIHTNDGFSTIIRLLSLGINQELLFSSLAGIFSQRLVSKLCDNCKLKYKATKEQKKNLNLNTEREIFFYKEIGCNECRKGFKGRQLIIEILEINKYFKENIVSIMNNLENKENITYLFEKLNIKSLYDSAIEHLLKGDITYEDTLKLKNN